MKIIEIIGCLIVSGVMSYCMDGVCLYAYAYRFIGDVLCRVAEIIAENLLHRQKMQMRKCAQGGASEA